MMTMSVTTNLWNDREAVRTTILTMSTQPISAKKSRF